MSRTLVARVSAGVLLLLGCWIAYTQNQGKQPPPLTLNKVKEDLYNIEGDGGNVAVYVTGEGVILVDDKFEQDHENIMAKVKSVTDQPVKYVLSTHHHADHSGGNARFLPTAEIISTANARTNIVEHKQSNAPPGVAPGASGVHRGVLRVSGRQGGARALLRPRTYQRRCHHLLPGAANDPYRRPDGGHDAPDRLSGRRQRGRVDQDAGRGDESWISTPSSPATVR